MALGVEADMANYYRVAPGLCDHPKVWRAATELQVTHEQIVGHLLRLWDWAYTHGDDGELHGISGTADLAYCCRYNGDPSTIASALLSARLIDDRDGVYYVHDWCENSGSGDRWHKRTCDRVRVATTRAATKAAATSGVSQNVAATNSDSQDVAATSGVSQNVAPQRKGRERKGKEINQNQNQAGRHNSAISDSQTACQPASLPTSPPVSSTSAPHDGAGLTLDQVEQWATNAHLRIAHAKCWPTLKTLPGITADELDAALRDAQAAGVNSLLYVLRVVETARSRPPPIDQPAAGKRRPSAAERQKLEQARDDMVKGTISEAEYAEVFFAVNGREGLDGAEVQHGV